MIEIIARTYKEHSTIIMRFKSLESAEAKFEAARQRFNKFCSITDDAGDKHYRIDIKDGFSYIGQYNG